MSHFFFPFTSLVADQRQLGLVVAVLIGFGFGFVLERAGFGRAQKLIGQFLLSEMTVLKVMFGAVATAMVGAVALSGVGLMDLREVANSGTSPTWIWPMLVGGFVVGMGFVISSYCPGTSVVAMASGKIDGLFTVLGVILGSVVGGELLGVPAVAAFNDSGYLGNLYLYDLLGVPAAVVAVAVALVAVGAFLGAEKLEGIFRRDDTPPSPARPRRATFATLVGVGAFGVVALGFPRPVPAAPSGPATISAEALARRLFDEPWAVRVLDLRAKEACFAQRVLGSECTPAGTLKELALADLAGVRDLVVVGEGDLAAVPPEVAAYPGQVLVLQQGFQGWKDYALTPPAPLPAGATEAERQAWKVRAGVVAAMTGVKQAPPPAAPAGGAAPAKRKAGGGGCSG